MAQRVALKTLTNSDLTFFESQFRMRPRQRQKSINLDASVFVDQFYPALANAGRGRIQLEVEVLGPGTAGPLIVSRKVVRSKGSKNWRLNGEFVRDPDGRFAPLRAGDLAVLSFDGEGAPSRVTVAVLARSNPLDRSLVEALAAMMPRGRRSTISVDPEALATLISDADPDAEHSIHHLAFGNAWDALIEDAERGGAAGAMAARRHRVTRSLEQLADIRANAAETGATGERLALEWLTARLADEPDAVRWISQDNAVNPWDLEFDDDDGTVRVEVKSTRADHGTTFYISAAELDAATEDTRFLLVRVSELSDERGRVATSTDLPEMAREILEVTTQLPSGVRPTQFAIDPVSLAWKDHGVFELPGEEE